MFRLLALLVILGGCQKKKAAEDEPVTVEQEVVITEDEPPPPAPTPLPTPPLDGEARRVLHPSCALTKQVATDLVIPAGDPFDEASESRGQVGILMSLDPMLMESVPKSQAMGGPLTRHGKLGRITKHTPRRGDFVEYSISTHRPSGGGGPNHGMRRPQVRTNIVGPAANPSGYPGVLLEYRRREFLTLTIFHDGRMLYGNDLLPPSSKLDALLSAFAGSKFHTLADDSNTNLTLLCGSYKRVQTKDLAGSKLLKELDRFVDGIHSKLVYRLFSEKRDALVLDWSGDFKEFPELAKKVPEKLWKELGTYNYQDIWHPKAIVLARVDSGELVPTLRSGPHKERSLWANPSRRKNMNSKERSKKFVDAISAPGGAIVSTEELAELGIVVERAINSYEAKGITFSVHDGSAYFHTLVTRHHPDALPQVNTMTFAGREVAPLVPKGKKLKPKLLEQIEAGFASSLEIELLPPDWFIEHVKKNPFIVHKGKGYSLRYANCDTLRPGSCRDYEMGQLKVGHQNTLAWPPFAPTPPEDLTQVVPIADEEYRLNENFYRWARQMSRGLYHKDGRYFHAMVSRKVEWK